jgi:hypothetical protein
VTDDPSIVDDANSEPLSTIEALDDIADAVETIVLNFAGEQERDAYLTLADEYQFYLDTLPDEPAQRTPEENERLLKLETLMADTFAPLLEACPAHIRRLHEAVRQALEAEEAPKA